MKKFESPGEFAAFLEKLLPVILIAQAVGVQRAAAFLQEEVKADLGFYQTAAGPFPDWPELSEGRKNERERVGLMPNDPLLATGELHDHIDMTYEGMRAVIGVPHEIVGDGTRRSPLRDIGDVAIWMEEGTDRAPPRSFLGHAAFVHGKAAADIALKVVGAAVASQPIPNSPIGRPHPRLPPF